MPGFPEDAHLTLAAMRLPGDPIWDQVRAKVNRLSSKRKGRALFCIYDDRIVAVIGFTLRYDPVVAYVLAYDGTQSVGLPALLAAKQCLHFVAMALGRSAEIYFDSPRNHVQTARRLLGFRNAGKPHRIRASATLLVQDP